MLQDYRHVYEFMESLPDLNEMKPQDRLIKSGNAWVLGKENHYVVYLLEGGSITVDLRDTRGELQVQWYNPRTGEFLPHEAIVGNQSQKFKAPDEKDWVVHISE